MTAEVAKQGLTRILTYAELIKEIDKDKLKTSEIRKAFDRNAWYFHESPQGQALNTNSIHPADLQQQNFKKMAEEATRTKEEAQTLDVEDITDLKDDAISDFEMSFDKERELREENERKIAEQVNMSHAKDHYQANKGAYDAIGATASAGIQEEEQASSSISRKIMKKVLKSSKPAIKAVATATGTAKGGEIGGLIASKLTDTIMPDQEEQMTEKEQRTKIKLIKKHR